MSNGGPAAFPGGAPYYDAGMTLRDYFAAKAMQAYVSSDKWREDMDSIRTASMAYRMADAMIKERDK
jgi:hypothetical protein